MIAREYPSDLELLEWAAKKLEKGVRVALVTITSKEGSAPRGIGAKMLVSEDDEVIGTIGGGELERIVVEKAKEVLRENRPRSYNFSLFRGQAPPEALPTGQLCGGVVTVFIDLLRPLQRLVVIGAGHIARPLSMLGKMLGYKVIVIDNLPGYATKEKIPYADEILVEKDIVKALEKIGLNKNDRVIITHGEADTEASVLKYVLSLKELPIYIGLLAGKGKLRYILSKLLGEGISPENIEKHLFSPAGLAIGSETPEEIAVSIIAEMLKVEKGAVGGHESIVDKVLGEVLAEERKMTSMR